MRLDPNFLGGHVEPRGAIDTIVIKQRHRRHLQLSAARNQVFG
jgi:hypothetical protein